MNVAPSILVTLLNPLEVDGDVSRDRDPGDRRRHVVTITPAGERLGRAARAQREAEGEMLAGLTAGQRDQLRDLLVALDGSVGDVGCNPAGACDEP